MQRTILSHSRCLPRAACALILALALPAAARAAEPAGPRPPIEQTSQQPSKQPVPGLAYGHSDQLPLPKTILFAIGPDQIIADAEEWHRRGIDAFFIDFVARDWSSDIWARDGKPWTIGPSDETFQQTRRANQICRRLGMETFLKVAFDHTFEWFNDIAWQQIDHNFRQFAIFARETGCTGIALDIEYVGEQYSFDWEGYDYVGYTRQDLVAKIRERMTRVLSILYDEFPDMVFITFPEQSLSLGAHIHTAWIEEAARRDAPGGIHYCMESTYRNPNINYMFGYAWLDNQIIQRLLSDRARRYWVEKCTMAAGVWPFGSDEVRLFGPGMTYDAFRQGFAASLMMSPRYNWLYGSYCLEQLIGRDLDKYHGPEDILAHLRVFADKDIVTTPKYVALAQEVRRKTLRDYSADLGVTLVPSLLGPHDLVIVRLEPAAPGDARTRRALWNAALAYFWGEEVDFQSLLGTQTHWMLIGPFPNEGVTFPGHHAAYPPEHSLDLSAEYDGLGGKVRWIEHRARPGRASVDLKAVFSPAEYACAYALCYVTSPREVQCQVRLGTNDSGKLWVGGELVFDYPYEGGAILDREIIPVTLPKGTTPILLKVCNGRLNWGFIFRITDREGRPLSDLRFTTAPPG